MHRIRGSIKKYILYIRLFLMNFVICFMLLFIGIGVVNAQSWIVGSGGDSWSGNVVYDDTTEVWLTGKVELRQLVNDYVSYWKFDEGSGLTAYNENKTNDNDGSLTNMNPTTSWVNGKYGKALDFDGSDDYVDCGNDESLDIIDKITIEAWVNVKQYDVCPIVKKYSLDVFSGYELRIQQGGKFELCGDNNGTSRCILQDQYEDTFDTDKWYHVVGLFEGSSRMALYVNGVCIKEKEITGYLGSSSPENLIIGKYLNHYFNGMIDEVRIYNRVLTPTEINQTMNNEHYALGNLTSISKDAEDVAYAGDVWKQIKFEGAIPVDSNVSIYTNSSSDNSTWTDWILVKENAISGMFYELPEINQRRYAKWRLVLNTTDLSITPEIEKVIFVAEKVDFSTSLDKITVFPNPYYVDDRNWPGRISFTNLPRETTIKIYTVAGKLIKTIKHWDTADGGSEEWDVSGIAGGIYMYTIISPEGTRKGKVSIIK